MVPRFWLLGTPHFRGCLLEAGAETQAWSAFRQGRVLRDGLRDENPWDHAVITSSAGPTERRAGFSCKVPVLIHVKAVPLDVDAYSAASTLPRLTLSPSRARSDQNDSDDSIVNAPSVSKV